MLEINANKFFKQGFKIGCAELKIDTSPDVSAIFKKFVEILAWFYSIQVKRSATEWFIPFSQRTSTRNLAIN